MPNFGNGEWINSAALTRETVRGKIVLVDFWDYSCINCVRTLPYVAEWHKRYAEHGLLIIGIHTPEFKFAHHRPQIEAAINEFNLQYPILLDNDYSSWDVFANKAWPTKYLIDERGYIRYMRRGEGGYADTELAIQQLIKGINPDADLPEIMPALREEDETGAVCYKPTPEIYAGFSSGAFFAGGLGNPEGYLPHENAVYNLPSATDREEGHFFIEGIWKALPESLVFTGKEHGRVILPYKAAGINVVLSPSADEVELRLGLYPPHNGQAIPHVEVKIDGNSLNQFEAGSDIQINDEGASVIPVNRPRMYHIATHHTYDAHELELVFRTSGIALYTFTFTTCTK